MDRLSTLLSRFGVRSNLFYNDALCSLASYGHGQRGHLHLLQSGSVTVRRVGYPDVIISQPSLIFLPRPSRHDLIGQESDGARLLCATIEFEGGVDNPLAVSLPALLVLPLEEMPLLATTLAWMFDEARDGLCGKEAVVSRLFELLVIQLLRHLLDHNQLRTGLMAGLADPRLARSLVRVLDAPEYPWTIANMADESNMSRSAYAAHFRTVIGQTPAEFLLSWRVSLTQKLLREGRSVNVIAAEVGYESGSALSRAFRRKTGVNPRDWTKDFATDMGRI